MAILRDDGCCVEGRGRAHDRANIVRIGHLIEHDKRPGRIGIHHFVQEAIFQRIAIQHQALVRRIAGDQPGKVSRLGIFDREIGRQFAIKRGDAFARGPQLAVVAFRILERGLHGMAAPQSHRTRAGPSRAAPALHSARAAAQRAAGPGVTIAAHITNPLIIGRSLGEGGVQG